MNVFIGMWAAAIYNAREHTLLLSRDPFGIKPLYYSFNRHRLLFGSEIKFLLQLDPSLRIIDLKTIYDFLIYDAKDHSQNTFYQAIKQVEPRLQHFV